MSATNAGLLMTIREAAQLLGQPERRLYRWAAEGRLPGVRRFGRAVYVSREELERWLVGNGAAASSEEPRQPEA